MRATLRASIRFGKPRLDQSGINMIDLMMWLVIAALILASALQSIGYYQKAATAYQAKSDVMGAFTWVSAATSIAGGDTPTEESLLAALNSGDLKLTSSGGAVNTAIISSPDAGEELCVGVRAMNLEPPQNVFYVSAEESSKVIQSHSLPSSCGEYNETMVQGSGSGGYVATNNLTFNGDVASLTDIVSYPGMDPARFKTPTHVKTGGPTAELPSYVHNEWAVGLTNDKNYWAGITNMSKQMRPLTPGKTYEESVWVRTSKDLYVHTDALVQDINAVTILDTPNVNQLVKANEWTQLKTSWTAPTGSYYAKVRGVLGGMQTVEAGTTIDVTGFSLTEKK